MTLKNNQQRREEAQNKERLARADYLKRKEEVMLIEPDNYDKLYLVKTHDDWGYKMFDHSALFYKYWAAPKFGGAPRLKMDTDFSFRTRDGVCAVRAMDSFNENMRHIGVKLAENQDNMILIYQLPVKLTEEDVKKIRKSDQLKWDKANSLIDVPPSLMPSLNKELKETETILFNQIRKMQKPARVLVGDEMMVLIRKMMTHFLMAMKGRDDVLKMLERIYYDSYKLESMMVTVMNEKLVDVDTAFKMAEKIQILQKKIEDMLTREKQRAALRENKDESNSR